MILFAYDGSADAGAAIDRMAEVMPGAEAIVLTIWEPFVDALLRTGALGMGMTMGMPGAFGDTAKIDAAGREAALATASEGAERANAAGLVAEPRSESRERDVAETILDVAEEADADVIAMGTRGLSGVKSFLLGSVSHTVLQHADRAVLVVPSAVVAERRRAQVRQYSADAPAVPA